VVDRAAAGSQASGRAAGLFKSVQPDQARTLLARRSIEKATRFEEWAGVPLTSSGREVSSSRAPPSTRRSLGQNWRNPASGA